jgi:hypothetical protein
MYRKQPVTRIGLIQFDKIKPNDESENFAKATSDRSASMLMSENERKNSMENTAIYTKYTIVARNRIKLVYLKTSPPLSNHSANTEAAIMLIGFKPVIPRKLLPSAGVPENGTTKIISESMVCDFSI